MKKLIPLLLAFTFISFAHSFAGKDYKEPAAAEALFKDNEFQADVFGSYGYGENEKKTKTVYSTKTSYERRIITFAAPQQGPTERRFRVTVRPRQQQINGAEAIIENDSDKSRSAREKTTGHTGLFGSDNAFGGGIAANYFFARYFGVGAEADWLAGESAIHLLDGNLFLRYPFEFYCAGSRRGLAPYLFGGYGARFDGTKWGIGHVGAGIEFRMCHNLGWFFDGRFVFGHHDAEAGIWR